MRRKVRWSVVEGEEEGVWCGNLVNISSIYYYCARYLYAVCCALWKRTPWLGLRGGKWSPRTRACCPLPSPSRSILPFSINVNFHDASISLSLEMEGTTSDLPEIERYCLMCCQFYQIINKCETICNGLLEIDWLTVIASLQRILSFQAIDKIRAFPNWISIHSLKRFFIPIEKSLKTFFTQRERVRRE